MPRLVAVLAAIIAMSACRSTPEAPPPPPFKPVVDTKTLMLSLMEKQADIVWESVADTIVGNDIFEKRPQTDAEWLAVRNAAISVTEAGNLLMIKPRSIDEGWDKAALGLIAQGERMIAAIDKRDPKAVFDVGSDLYDSCVECHKNYMPAIRDMYRK
jgi:hypothetical protein